MKPRIRLFNHFIFLAWFFSVCECNVFESPPDQHHFNVELKLFSSWRKTSLLSQAVEFVSDLDAAQVPQALEVIGDELLNLQDKAATTDKQEEYTALERKVLQRLNATLFSSPYTGPLMGLAVENNYYSARVEFLRSEERRLKEVVGDVAPSCADTFRSSNKNGYFDSWVALCIPVCNSSYQFVARAFCSPEEVMDVLRTQNNSAVHARCIPPTSHSAFSSSYTQTHPCRLFQFDHTIVPFPLGSTESAKLHNDCLLFFRHTSEDDSHDAKTSSPAELPFFILFSSLNVNSKRHMLSRFLRALKDQESISKVPVVFRHGDSGPPIMWWGSDAQQQQPPEVLYDTLTGYGAELAIKNPEYSTADDSSTVGRDVLLKENTASEQAAEDAADDDDDLSLSSQYEIKQGYLDSQSQENMDVDRILSPKEIELLGLQAVTAISGSRVDTNHSTEEKLITLYKLSSNFPQEAVRLSKIRILPAVSAAVKKLHTKVHPRASVVTLNNHVVVGQTPSLFTLLQAVGPHLLGVELLMRESFSVKDALRWLQEPYHDDQQVSYADSALSTFLHWNSFPARLDWRFSTGVHSLEKQGTVPPIWDVTSHPAAAHWPEDIDRLHLFMSFRGLLKVKAPLHHILVIFDPLNLTQVEAARTFLQLDVPMRLYALPVASECVYDATEGKRWDSRRLGSIPSLLRNATFEFSDDNVEGNAFCLKRAVAGSLFLELVPSGRKTQTAFLMAKRQRQVESAFDFLIKAIDKVVAESDYKLWEKLFVDHGGQQTTALRIFQHVPPQNPRFPSPLFSSLVSYVKDKGLISNLVIVNGRLLTLRPLTSTVLIGHDEQRKAPLPVQASRILMAILLEDQQKIISAMLFGGYSFPNDASSIFTQGAAPTCLIDFDFVEDVGFQSKNAVFTVQSKNKRPKISPVCATLTWDGKSAEQRQSDNHVNLWDSYKRLGREDSLAITSKNMVWLTPALLKQWSSVPVFDHTATDAKSLTSGNSFTRRAWPVEYTVITNMSASGLKLVMDVLEHLKRSLTNKTTLTRLFDRNVLRFQWRLIFTHNNTVLKSNAQPFHGAPGRRLELFLEHILAERAHNITLNDRLDLAHRLTNALYLLLKNGLVLNTAMDVDNILFFSVFDAWSTSVVERGGREGENSSSEQDDFVVEFKRALEHIPDKLRSQDEEDQRTAAVEQVLRKLKEQARHGSSPTSSHETVDGLMVVPSIAINGRVILFTQDELRTSNMYSRLNLWELLCLGQELGTLMSYQRETDNASETSSSNDVGTDGYVSETLQKHSPTTIAYAAAIRQRLLEKSDPWNGLRELYQQARAHLKVDLKTPRPLLPPFHVYAMLDPISTAAQNWLPLLDILNRVFNADVKILLNPSSSLKEYPLNRWYRQAIRFPKSLALNNASAVFCENKPPSSGSYAGVYFPALKTNHTLTVGLYAPDPWLVRARRTEHDLDNLQPPPFVKKTGETTLSASFVLTNLFLEGQVSPAVPKRESIWYDGDLQKDELSHKLFKRYPSMEAIPGQELALYQSSAVFDRIRAEKPTQESTQLTQKFGKKVSDTVVMGNMGYFQLRAYPGLFSVVLEAHSQRTTSPFSIAAFDACQYNYVGNVKTVAAPVVLNALATGTARQMQLIMAETPENVGLIGTFAQRVHHASSSALIQPVALSPRSLLSTFMPRVVTESWKQLTKHVLKPECTERVHIFSVASGFMYERLLRIMILSVRQHTTCPLTFWFIGNFLSAKFRDIMPAMAERYRLEYHFVTYKWPSWLRKQTEKQRQIWAYKILFLDVLFPNAVEKVIYIDADQVVRGDIHDLWTLDLKGHVYGFTPFCESNAETRGLRFWKEGYWKSHLNGKPYHISALFVVDLVRFRRQKAGDLLRAAYMTLSQDRNSLANLDQDLPNFAQHEIPIFPLPQQWLWCETWCSKETLATAKTIDLCNNPMTKEPKLSQARRLIPEWVTYDQAIRDLEQEVLSRTNTVGSPLPPTSESIADSYVKQLPLFSSKIDDEL